MSYCEIMTQVYATVCHLANLLRGENPTSRQFATVCPNVQHTLLIFQLFFGLLAAITSSSVGGGRHLKSAPNLWNQLMLAAHCCQGNVYGMMALKIKFHTLPPPANGRRGHKYDAAFTGSDRVVRTPAKDASESFAKISVRVCVCVYRRCLLPFA